MTDQPHYPYADGDFAILGPEVFASADGQTISWQGANYSRHPGEIHCMCGGIGVTHDLRGGTQTTPDNAATSSDAADNPLRDLIAAALYEHSNPGHRWADAHAHDLAVYGADAAAVVEAILPTTRLLGALHQSAHDDVMRVIALYERWVKAGPPPLGASTSRWWDVRLAELHAAILPPQEQQ